MAKTFPYKCDLEIGCPTEEYSEKIKRVMEVDQELGDRVIRTYQLDGRIMKVSFQATEAKMLRVSVSTFYDYLNVALKCIQEFDS
eukprot:CAMPEP_0202447408 /NCGR_PEP_ID=MMETSP1360-20130828/6176_1 /ASSEMBLY_ACC=CAM_ASM_000848 /TAXON_ID=515479 /ORGANISM="Licmophora paradoxa, Strain CCMP2313" /LENGTH=84 /DNA_ID=CAMNT_0049064493 /DNA_START=87 /DNA_END=341 /DNA_ORIENTATION=+